MGSFANSVHVKCDDASRVVAAVGDALRDARYTTADQVPGSGVFERLQTSLRAVRVSEPHNGWVGVLDSDLMNCASLAAELSRWLDTFALFVFVNDSDSWYYQLFHRGTQLDEFDSSGGLASEGGTDELSPEFTEMLLSGGLETFQKDFERRGREIQEKIERDLPDHIRDIQQRMQNGTATQKDLKRYGKFHQSHALRYMGEINQMLSGITKPSPEPSARESDVGVHVKKLRPILRPDVKDKHVLKILRKHVMFAEETLGEFLPLVGIPPIFANLSYEYLVGFPEAELRAANVRMAAHLTFKTEGGEI